MPQKVQQDPSLALILTHQQTVSFTLTLLKAWNSKSTPRPGDVLCRRRNISLISAYCPTLHSKMISLKIPGTKDRNSRQVSVCVCVCAVIWRGKIEPLYINNVFIMKTRWCTNIKYSGVPRFTISLLLEIVYIFEITFCTR